jgi:two-component system, NarL family, invasion response regulator UvrY
MGSQSADPVRLVVADDSPQARRAIEAIIDRSPDFDLVGTASSGEEAVELVGRVEPDLALLDVRMPGMGGIEAARRIAGSRPETVVLLVSALDEGELPSAVGTCGVIAVIHKSTFSARRLAAAWRQRGHG